MVITLRSAQEDELPAISALCLRSKGHWGYDTDFLEACREVLTLTVSDLENDYVMVADCDGQLLGVVHLQIDGDKAVLDKLFIDPSAIGGGVGRVMYDWAIEKAQSLSAKSMTIDADPDAERFYAKMGAKTVSRVPSEVIEGRTRPLMEVLFS